MLQIAICEDQATELKKTGVLLQSYLAAHQLSAGVSSFRSGEEFLLAHTPGRYQIVLLDIYMDGMSGMEVAQRLRALDDPCSIIFITSSESHALMGFEVQAAHYILKPITLETLTPALNRCADTLARGLKSISIRTAKADVDLPVESIYYIEIYDKISHIHYTQGCVTTYSSLDTLEKELMHPNFFRCHRSYLINMRYIDQIGAKEVAMQNGDIVPFSKNNKKLLRDRYSQYMIALTRGQLVQ